jgi:hypothetical protein
VYAVLSQHLQHLVPAGVDADADVLAAYADKKERDPTFRKQPQDVAASE